jgi:hypothetical protein
MMAGTAPEVRYVAVDDKVREMTDVSRVADGS